MKRFSILGVSLVDFSAREGLRLADRYLHNGALNTATYITAQTLAQAAKEEQWRNYLEDADLTFCVSPDILEAAGIDSAGRVREIEERIFLKEFLKRLARQQDSIFLLGDTMKQAQELAEMLLSQQETLNIAGVRGFEEFDQQTERLMNALNEAAPKVIFSRMTWPTDLELMSVGRKFLNAELWVALPDKKLPGKSKPTVLHNIRKRLFKKKVNEYNEEKAEH